MKADLKALKTLYILFVLSLFNWEIIILGRKKKRLNANFSIFFKSLAVIASVTYIGLLSLKLLCAEYLSQTFAPNLQ